ncbi:MAG: GGDEF domain-containing protein [Alphaproteobacteria bacterium]|nr:GGDEF domain-containing protein [Alphaproteobacteria bacterium]
MGNLTADAVVELLLSKGHSLLVRQRRAHLIMARTRTVAAVFAIFTPLWIILDLTFFPWPLWGWLALARIACTVVFAWIALAIRNTDSVNKALRVLFLLHIVPTAFFLVAEHLLLNTPVGISGEIAAAGYQFLPYVMVSSLGMFPITLLDAVVFSSPMVLVVLAKTLEGNATLSFNSHFGAIWLLLLTVLSAALAGMSQLYFMSALVTQSSHDLLTLAYTRRVGEELLDMLFISVARAGMPMTVAFIDLDNFKSVNDQFGHDEGDRTLSTAAEKLRSILRRNDVLIRWGGEELVLVLPFTNYAGAKIAINRLVATGIGSRPDGKPQTASVGLAERLADDTMTWQILVEKADRRMYTAKQSGKDRAVMCGEEVLLFKSAERFLPPVGNISGDMNT